MAKRKKREEKKGRFEKIAWLIILIVIFGIAVSVILFSDNQVNVKEIDNKIDCGKTILDNDNLSSKESEEYLCFRHSIEHCLPAKLVAYKVQINRTSLLQVEKLEKNK